MPNDTKREMGQNATIHARKLPTPHYAQHIGRAKYVRVCRVCIYVHVCVEHCVVARELCEVF